MQGTNFENPQEAAEALLSLARKYRGVEDAGNMTVGELIDQVRPFMSMSGQIGIKASNLMMNIIQGTHLEDEPDEVLFSASAN